MPAYYSLTPRRVLIVEGKTDKARLIPLLHEDVEIICTSGTLSYETLEEVIFPLQYDDVYILVDADESGMKLRRQLKQALPNAQHLYTRKVYREVATTPLEHLAKVLQSAKFEVDAQFLSVDERLFL